MTMYANDNDNNFPPRYRGYAAPFATPARADVTPFNGTDVGGFWTTTTVMGPYGMRALFLQQTTPPRGDGRQAYLKSNEAFFCPSDKVVAPFIDPVTGWGKPFITSPAAGNSCSYMIWYVPKDVNKTGTPCNLQFGANWANKQIENNRTDIKGSAQRVILADQGWILVNGHAQSLLTVSFPMVHRGSNDNDGGYNALYIDGHVNWVKRSEMKDRVVPTTPLADYAPTVMRAFNSLY
jgi:prepilin-type processing-associated H-X9-DG protein